MKLYEITINPQSAFGTHLKGDTIFGSFCWQAAHDPDLLVGGLARWMDCYHERPCVVFSSAWPKFYDRHSKTYTYILKRPDLPMHWLFPPSGKDKMSCMEERKDNQKKRWMPVGESLSFTIPGQIFKTDVEVLKDLCDSIPDDVSRHFMDNPEIMRSHERQHNSINRLTSTTGSAPFTPYSIPVFSYLPLTELAIFVLVDEEATTIGKVRTAIERIGAFGFGKDASTGCGRFIMGEESDEIILKRVPGANASYALSPSVPDPETYDDIYFSPFTRFGKHGDELAQSLNPFKNPVIMADEGAVCILKDSRNAMPKPFIGRSVHGVSKAMPETVHQGYSICLPFSMEVLS